MDGDTGWRDVTSLLTTAPTDGTWLLRRVGPEVTHYLAGLVVQSGFLPEPAGFVHPARRASQDKYGGVLLIPSGPNVVASHVPVNVNRFAGNRIQYGSYTTTAYGTGHYMTGDPWPTALPGTAA